MERSPSWEAKKPSAGQEIPMILRNQKVHYGFHKCPPLVFVLDQSNPAMPPHPTFWRSVLMSCSLYAKIFQVVDKEFIDKLN